MSGAELLTAQKLNRQWMGIDITHLVISLIEKARAEHPDYEPDFNFKKAKQEGNTAQKELI